MGTKKTCFLCSKVEMFAKLADRASFDAKATSNGRSHRRWAFDAMVTAVSVMPQAILARVLPVQGAMTKASRGEAGPSGSAMAIVWMTGREQMAQIRSIRRAEVPNRVSVEYTHSLTIGCMSYPFSLSSERMERDVA